MFFTAFRDERFIAENYTPSRLPFDNTNRSTVDTSRIHFTLCTGHSIEPALTSMRMDRVKCKVICQEPLPALSFAVSEHDPETGDELESVKRHHHVVTPISRMHATIRHECIKRAKSRRPSVWNRSPRLASPRRPLGTDLNPDTRSVQLMFSIHAQISQIDSMNVP